MKDAALFVQSFDKSWRDFLLWSAVGSEPVPVPLDHCVEAPVRREALPFELGAPVAEGLARPGLAEVVPQMSEGLFQYVGSVEPLVGGEQQLEVLASWTLEVLQVGEQRALLPLDKRSGIAIETSVPVHTDLVERLPKMN